jgi:hypothetical protein
MGNLVMVTEPNPAGGADWTTSYTYNVLNHLTQVSMPRNGYTPDPQLHLERQRPCH